MDVKFIEVGKVAIAVLIVSPWYLLRMLADINGQITKERKWLIEKRKGTVVLEGSRTWDWADWGKGRHYLFGHICLLFTKLNVVFARAQLSNGSHFCSEQYVENISFWKIFTGVFFLSNSILSKKQFFRDVVFSKHLPYNKAEFE